MNDTCIWCATIIVATAMLALAVMSSAHVFAAHTKDAIEPCMWFCAIIGTGGIACLVWPSFKKWFDAPGRQESQTERKNDD